LRKIILSIFLILALMGSAAAFPSSQAVNDAHKDKKGRSASRKSKKPAKDQAETKDEMVQIPGGTFMMGCSPGDKKCGAMEKPQHKVTLKGFLMDAKEVTNGQYRLCVNAGACQAARYDKAPYTYLDQALPYQPVVGVTWRDANDYCTWAKKRLPTEAEWEYAARGGSADIRYGPADEIAWYYDNTGGQPGKFKPVGLKKPNAYGLYDMLGNVDEWCADWYDPNYYSVSPADYPKGPASSPMFQRVYRGGYYGTSEPALTVSTRYALNSSQYSENLGFRCVR